MSKDRIAKKENQTRIENTVNHLCMVYSIYIVYILYTHFYILRASNAKLNDVLTRIVESKLTKNK